MTTVAVSHTEIAYDSQVTYGNRKAATPRPKVTIVKGTVYAAAGDASAVELLPKWHQAGAKPDKAPKGDWEFLAITRAGMRHYTDSSPHGVSVQAPMALGSGGDFALAAMVLGHSATDGVKLAAALDVYTGFEIASHTLEDVLGPIKKPRKKRRAAQRSRGLRLTVRH